MHSYSQLKAMLAITKASLRSTFRSPSAVIFSIAFPLIFILVFGIIPIVATPKAPVMVMGVDILSIPLLFN